MKDKFLKDLKEALNQHQIENVDEIIDKYEKRFILGYEADMKDEEIIEALESIEDIVGQYETKKNYQLHLDLTMFSDFEIIQNKNLNKPYLFDLNIDPFDFEEEEDKVKEYVQIKEDNRYVSLNNIKQGKDGLSGSLYIGTITEIDKVYIVTNSCDVYIKDLKAKEICIKNSSGDFDIHKIHANDIKIENISGDIKIDDLVSEHLTLTSTSGDISIGKLKVDEVMLTTVSGDLEIDQLDAGSGKISTVSGDIAYSLGDNPTNDIEITTVSGTIEEE